MRLGQIARERVNELGSLVDIWLLAVGQLDRVRDYAECSQLSYDEYRSDRFAHGSESKLTNI